MKPSSSTLWIFFNLTLGAVAGATLGWGPLAAPRPLVAVLALAGAAVGAAIGVWSRPRPRRRYVGWGHGGIVLFVTLATLIPLYRIGAIAPPGETRAANFARLQRALDYAYPYFELKGGGSGRAVRPLRAPGRGRGQR